MPVETPTKVNAVVSFSDETVRDTKAENNRTHATQDSIKNAAWAAFVAASIYALIAAVQLLLLRNANVISREGVESVQRAFVSFQHFEYMRIQDPDNSNVHTWNINALFENSGITNATNVAGMAEIKELPAEPTEEYFKGPYSHFPVIGMPPKSNRTVRVLPPVPEPLLFGVDLGPTITVKSVSQTHFNRHLFIWGWAYYRDVFPETKPHITEFCTHLTGINLITANLNSLANGPLSSQAAGSNINFVYENCNAHNCDDEQCADYQTIVEMAQKTN